jgi:alanine racemase
VNGLDSFFRPTWAEISLDALEHNLHAFRKAIPAHMKIMAVVKANAYGHGAVEVAEEAVRCGANYLAVAFLDEALELRRAGITCPVLVLGYTPPECLELAVSERITLTVYSEDILDAIMQRGTNGERLNIHIKIDTGMGRLGVLAGDEAVDFIEKALQLPGVNVEGLYTHFACADERDKSYTYGQYGRFQSIVEHFRGKNIEFDYLHTGNSATAIDCPELSYNMVRLGISLYGLYPSEEVSRQNVDLRPVMSFKTTVVRIRTLPPGSGISYGSIYRTRGEEQIATLPVGYADGFTRLLTERGHALIHGRKVPVVGRICMDQCMINVTGVENVRIGEEVVLFGRQGEAEISADELARALGTINYEITCMVADRVPRVYIRNSKKLSVRNPLLR